MKNGNNGNTKLNPRWEKKIPSIINTEPEFMSLDLISYRVSKMRKKAPQTYANLIAPIEQSFKDFKVVFEDWWEKNREDGKT